MRQSLAAVSVFFSFFSSASMRSMQPVLRSYETTPTKRQQSPMRAQSIERAKLISNNRRRFSNHRHR
jgi:hypothetical protein